MQLRYKNSTNGSEVNQSDINQVAQDAALADDIVFAELFRLQPWNGASAARGVLPYKAQSFTDKYGCVVPNGASGSAIVNPFRVFVGSRDTAANTSGLLNLSDIRSAVTVGASALTQTATFGANASGNPRWDLVVIALAVDATQAAVTRYVKPANGSTPAATSVNAYLATTATVQVVAGTAAASPQVPSLPADAGGIYYIPIAAVRIPNGFNGTSTIAPADIFDYSTVLRATQSTGGVGAQAANVHSSISGAILSQASIIANWGSTGTRPETFIPSGMTGGRMLFFVLDFVTAGLYTNGMILDDSDNWLNRYWSCFNVANAQGTASFASSTAGTAGNPVPSCVSGNCGSTTTVGQSFSTRIDGAGNTGLNVPIVTYLTNTQLSQITSPAKIAIYADPADGKLKLYLSGSPGCRLFVWAMCSGPMPNYA